MSVIVPSQKNLKVVSENGKLTFRVIEVPRYPLKVGRLEGEPIYGTELYFEGRLFYPAIYGVRMKTGWAIPKAEFLPIEEIFFYNPHLDREETELDLQGYFRGRDSDNWKYYMEELRNQSFNALKIAFKGYQEYIGGKGNAQNS